MASTSPSRNQPRPSRRRQRSVRVTVAVALLSLATLAVILALPTGSVVWMGVASVLSLVCGWASARIIYNELAQSRRENFADRAATADAYRTMFSARADEHAEFTTGMTDRLKVRDREIRELSGTLVLAEKRVAEAESRVNREARRANEAQAKVSELEEALEIKSAEDADQLAIWDAAQIAIPGFDEDLETVVDLLAWEEKAVQAKTPKVPVKKRA